jgi:hypothetical protein
VRDHHIRTQLIHHGLDRTARRKQVRVDRVPKRALRNAASHIVEWPIDVADRLSRFGFDGASGFKTPVVDPKSRGFEFVAEGADYQLSTAVSCWRNHRRQLENHSTVTHAGAPSRDGNASYALDFLKISR